MDRSTFGGCDNWVDVRVGGLLGLGEDQGRRAPDSPRLESGACGRSNATHGPTLCQGTVHGSIPALRGRRSESKEAQPHPSVL